MKATQQEPGEGKASGSAAPANPASPQMPPDREATGMQTAYAKVCELYGSREEVTLLFGPSDPSDPSDPGNVRPGTETAPAAVSERIVLTPYTAKRLAALLEQGVAEYERRFGEIKP